jgi:hypothetical protein
LFAGAVGLDAPINYWLVYLSPLVIVLLAFFYKRTPVDIFAPRLDQLIVSVFRTKPLICGVCRRSANNRCEECSQPACLRHGNIRRDFRVICSNCVKRLERGLI